MITATTPELPLNRPVPQNPARGSTKLLFKPGTPGHERKFARLFEQGGPTGRQIDATDETPPAFASTNVLSSWRRARPLPAKFAVLEHG